MDAGKGRGGCLIETVHVLFQWHHSFVKMRTKENGVKYLTYSSICSLWIAPLSRVFNSLSMSIHRGSTKAKVNLLCFICLFRACWLTYLILQLGHGRRKRFYLVECFLNLRYGEIRKTIRMLSLTSRKHYEAVR